VTLIDASAEALSRVAEALGVRFPRARVATFVADVSNADQAIEAVQLALQANGRLDILVNNAAMRNYSDRRRRAASRNGKPWSGVNLIGTANYCKAALPALRRSGKGAS
jgi:meso-butanediol dehydrogenase/(S,S)-butanediol dehydrogenase/diacetyl reductase